MSVFVSRSHPLARLLSQSARPALHVKPQLPLEQVGVAPARAGHGLLQPPQWAVSTLVLRSQPLAGLPSQSAFGALQVKPQLPPEQVGVAPGRAGHALLQPPQWARSVLVLRSQPLTAFPSQSAFGPVQEKPQLPLAQVRVEPGRLGHELLQAPQCARSLPVLRSQPLAALPSQSAFGAMQLNPQEPLVQVRVAPERLGQTRLHPPQWAISALVSISQPLAALPSQSPKTPPHSKLQLPERQARVALAGDGQSTPHRPQWDTLIDVSTHTDMPASVHSTSSQVEVQTPALQTSETSHAFPQAPQWSRLVFVLRSQPFAGEPSQSAKEPVHSNPQVPAAHERVAFAGDGQSRPQLPQCVTLVEVSTQIVPAPSAHSSRAQVEVQEPALQTSEPVQALLHAPQWAVLVRESASHSESPVQSRKKGSQPPASTPPSVETTPASSTSS